MQIAKALCRAAHSAVCWLLLAVLASSCTNPRYAGLNDLARQAQENDRRRREGPPPSPPIAYRPGNRIADGEVVRDNLPRASREARRYADLLNLPIESERAAILRLAAMQPIASEWMVKPLAELQRESDRLTLLRERHRRTADIVEQLQSIRSQGQSTLTAARQGDARAGAALSAHLARVGEDDYARTASSLGQRWTDLLRELAGRQSILDNSIHVLPVLMATNLQEAGRKLDVAKQAVEARSAALGNLVALLAVGLAGSGQEPPNCQILSEPARDRTPAGHEANGQPYVLVERCEPR